MVTCRLIGRTGNQMFQIAATIGYARKHDMQYHIPDTGTFKHLTNKKFSPSIPLIQLRESSFEYGELPAYPGLYNIELNGYFQSWKYFSHCTDEVTEAFNIPCDRKEGWTAIHYRSGDYKLKPNHHPIITKEYLIAAINKMIGGGYSKFMIFSEDIKEAIKDLDFCNIWDKATFHFTHNKTELKDLSLGGSCDNIIGSNSSFSLWMYYLNQNKNKTGIFPRRWFGQKLPNNTKDLYPPNCIIL